MLRLTTASSFVKKVDGTGGGPSPIAGFSNSGVELLNLQILLPHIKI
jgi:hypothetical protein